CRGRSWLSRSTPTTVWCWQLPGTVEPRFAMEIVLCQHVQIFFDVWMPITVRIVTLHIPDH
ncbi:MAG: hypothetical protein VX540_08795, partial [Pseudomonadota bacterium]|nr:hypothetical protein [Pseudomonadota bacterium]